MNASSAEFPKCRTFLQTLWKTLLVSGQPRTHQVMYGGVTEEVHLLHRLFCGPTLSPHAICRDHHSGPVITQAAVDSYPLVRILLAYFQEAREYIVFGTRT